MSDLEMAIQFGEVVTHDKYEADLRRAREEAIQPWKDACGLDNPADLEKLCDDRLDKMGVGMLAEALEPMDKRINEATVAAAGAQREATCKTLELLAAAKDVLSESESNIAKARMHAEVAEHLWDALEVLRNASLVTSEQAQAWLAAFLCVIPLIAGNCVTGEIHNPALLIDELQQWAEDAEAQSPATGTPAGTP